MKAIGYAQIAPEEAAHRCHRCSVVFDIESPEDHTYVCPHCDHEHDAFEVEHSIPAQAYRVSRYIRDQLQGVSDVAISWELCEPTKRFGLRPSGKTILNEIGRGDCLIVSEFSRAFRNVDEFIDTGGTILSVGATIHVLEPAVVFTSDMTMQDILRHLRPLAVHKDPWMTTVKRQARRRGVPVNEHATLGYKWRRNQNGTPREIPDYTKMEFLLKLMDWRDAGHTWPEVQTLIKQHYGQFNFSERHLRDLLKRARKRRAEFEEHLEERSLVKAGA